VSPYVEQTKPLGKRKANQWAMPSRFVRENPLEVGEGDFGEVKPDEGGANLWGTS